MFEQRPANTPDGRRRECRTFPVLHMRLFD